MSEERGSPEFHEHATRVKNLPKRPSDEELLGLYGLYKQVTGGDADDFYADKENAKTMPGMFDLKGKAKLRAWQAHKGKPQEQAEREYIAMVEKLEGSEAAS